MIIVDQLLARREKTRRPIRVGIIGAGFMAGGVARQIIKYSQGMRLVAIANRTLSKAEKIFTDNGQKPRATTDPLSICRSADIDVVVEITGTVEYGARVVMEAIKNKKHVVLLNAELDGTVGSILKSYADSQGVIYTVSDGDQPGVTLNLYRFVKGIGLTPVLCGNIKGLHDPYRNPQTQAEFAKKWGQNPYMVTSFADGTKISFEQAVIANATGMSVAKRGMYGPDVAGRHVYNSPTWYPKKALLKPGGIVDYCVGANPNPGVFVIATTKDKRQKHFLNLYKLGKGPFYVFYTPYHLCHFEVPASVARAALLGDAALAPIGKPYCDVITLAKKDLKRGEVIDRLGGFMTYGVIENAGVCFKRKLLPIGLAEGCRLKKNIKKDQVITYADVDLPANRLADKLRKEQNEKFFS
jgi:predicted homoserine dehydrogenase-like protein